jgi:tetratricopeptide (TPR) repeat protein
MADTPRIEELKRRVLVDPASIAFAALAEEFRRAGRFEEAISTCTVGLQRHPSYLSAHVTLGRALIEVGRYEDAYDELQFVLSVAPENLAAIRGLADIQHRRGDDTTTQYPTEAELYASAPASPAPNAPNAPHAPHALHALESFLSSIVRARR